MMGGIGHATDKQGWTRPRRRTLRLPRGPLLILSLPMADSPKACAFSQRGPNFVGVETRGRNHIIEAPFARPFAGPSATVNN